ncbi:hypothetical protein [Pseudoalteromonas aurantia]|jgi:ABC-type uncharacterized transport system permease subunit|uniref:DUF3955 domain-containing protein n=1 Tax=Pseudoalteromonas aurantia TaxID=43654 RepID=A0A5S3VD08_9GAMM|nr:hypothetical protein [Pseudoalteromonas aurantia]TMO60601.1 hypothetical protein CWC18_13125 [Pseudoalteromonas aurantia]TMO70103.1 hypothetical protein CWC19_02660 [Pseudoalteromonas aurantia]TMO76129.1 hypothetical protein CWC20_06420 [Pseudoalteromonas aurantia]
MKTHSKRKELIMLPLLLVAILLCIGGHFILQPSFQESNIAEYSLAALPFLLFAIVIIAIRMAIKAEQQEE